MSDNSPIFRSPIVLPDQPVPEDSPVTGLTLSDLSGVSITLIQGKAQQALQERFGRRPEQPGQAVEVGEGLLSCLTPTEFYLFGTSLTARLPAAVDLNQTLSGRSPSACATDLTHGKAVLRLIGYSAAELLSKICGVACYDPKFPNLYVAQTSAAKIKTLIARYDEDETPAYFLHVDRPLGQYFWEVVWDAGQEFGIVVSAN
jgi:heterotetrameric sarcosine oxidase gamma subunit